MSGSDNNNGDIPQDFSRYPGSLKEHQAGKSADAKAWAPRDVLVSMLRDLDSGAVTAADLIVVYNGRRTTDPEGMTSVFYRVALKAGNIRDAVGLLEVAKHLILRKVN